MSYKAFAKVNIFLKITAFRGDYHELVSRFMIVENLFDELEFRKKSKNVEFELVGDFGCPLESNTIFKAYKALLKEGYAKAKDFLQSYSLHVSKNIPSFAGLGGGSSDAAAFLKMLNSEASLGMDLDKLSYIGSKVGADVPFFVYGFKSANVSGIGEIVKEFDEENLLLDIKTPPIECDTSKVYKKFRKDPKFDKKTAEIFKETPSRQLLENNGREDLNDLFNPAKELYPSLLKYALTGWFFSGSGSSFFRISDEI